MPLVGMLIGHQLNESFEFVAELLGPAIMIALGLYIIVTELLEKNQSNRKNIVNKGWMIILLPLMMSFDNLIAGVGLGTSGYPVISTSIVVGICAGGMCLVGLFIGERLRKWIPSYLEMLSGFYFIGLALVLILLD
jgi:putative Mn2+ efflux pump MntP